MSSDRCDPIKRGRLYIQIHTTVLRAIPNHNGARGRQLLAILLAQMSKNMKNLIFKYVQYIR